MRNSKKKWMINTEGVLLRLLGLFITVLLVSQLLLCKEETRLYLSKVDQMEGENLTLDMPLYADVPLHIKEETMVGKDYQQLLRKSKVIMIKMIKGTDGTAVFVLVNGKRVDDFGKGNSKITVYDGDYVEIDGRALNETLRFVVTVFDKEVLLPQNGLTLEGKNKIFTVGKIKFKNE